MTEATRLTRAGRLAEATALLQRLLAEARPAGGSRGTLIDGSGRDGRGQPAAGGACPRRCAACRPLRRGAGPGWAGSRRRRRPATPSRCRTARFVAGSFTSAAGTRAYKLYVPSGYRGQAAAAGRHAARLHPVAGRLRRRHADERAGRGAAASSSPTRRRRGRPTPSGAGTGSAPTTSSATGASPSLIAGITRQVMRDHAVDPARVYVAGMSAGGAEAAVMGGDISRPVRRRRRALRPRLRGGQRHALGLRRDAAGRRPAAATPAGPARRPDDRVPRRPGPHRQSRATATGSSRRRAAAAAACSTATVAARPGARRARLHAARVHADAAGRAGARALDRPGAGHAWSGGSPAGTYTDPRGPDASREMLRFFLAHRAPRAG